ncbi:glycine-rich domain-containing 2-like [Brachionus plicatilis]|uniref:Glycine-rich domain-containing 2-like n=1 Tax=Brachionus plicatilis TaxID=10195 RepID=A0A3M7QR03_BRAPC|nr:glycine-rich domain-containing 2-like [Brachionus plicatilis]
MDSLDFKFESESSKNFDLIEQTLKHLEFLKLIDDAEIFYTGPTLDRAIYRYETVWIPFCIQIDSTIGQNRSEICPPLDIAWVWHCHLLSPSYANDLKSAFGKIIDHKCIDTRHIQQKHTFTKQLWQKFTSVEFDYENKNSVDSKFDQFKSTFSLDFTEASLRQKNFFYQVSLPHFRCRKFLQKALEKYKKFILLKKKYPSSQLVPCYATNVIWRTHQLNPSNFHVDMKSLSLKTKIFCDLVNQKQEDLTRKFWKQAYNESLLAFGCVHRGAHPTELEFWHDKKDINFYMDQVVLIEFKFEITGLNGQNEDYLFEASILTDQEENAFGDIIPNSKVSFSRTFILKDYEPKLTQIKLAPKACKLKNFLSKSSLVKSSKLIFVVELADLPLLGQKSMSMPFSLNDEKKFNLNLNLNLKTIRKEINLGLKKSPFAYVKFSQIVQDYKSLFNLRQLSDDLDQVLRAKHFMVAIGANMGIFDVEVVHIPSVFWSSIRILNENKTVVSAHIMEPTQLPRPECVENPDHALDPRNEKAILVRDGKGDFAIIKGKWVITNDIKLKHLLVKIIYLRDSRSMTRLEISENSKSLVLNGKWGEFYGANLDMGLVWVISSETDADKFEWSVEIHLAVVFSISVLYASTFGKEYVSKSSSEETGSEQSEFSSYDENIDQV